MTTPKVTTFKRGDARFYVEPETQRSVPGVTSVIDMLPKPFLKFWAAQVTADCAVAQAGAWIGMALNGDTNGAVDYLKRAHIRERKAAAGRGDEAHKIFEKLAKGESVPKRSVPEEYQPYADHFREFLEVWQPEFTHLEQTVWSDEHNYAGSLDALAILDVGNQERATVILDWKTNRKRVYPEVALQLTAYASAEYMIDAEGNFKKMVDVEAAAVLHVTPEGWQLIPVRCTPDVFETFLALRAVFDWDKEHSNNVLGKPFVPFQEKTLA